MNIPISTGTICSRRIVTHGLTWAVLVGGVLAFANTASAQTSFGQTMSYASTVDDEASLPESSGEQGAVLAERLQRTIVAYDGREAPGTVIIDTGNTYLYYVLGGGKAIRYGVGVGRQGFTWSGVETVSRKAEWPDWIPPSEMIARQPYLPRWVAGGPSNPLGARAMDLGNSSYRIHGTNDPTSIGKYVSSGCIRMTNDDVIDLFSRVQVGAKVMVLPKHAPDVAARGSSSVHSPQAVLLTTSRRATASTVSGVY